MCGNLQCDNRFLSKDRKAHHLEVWWLNIEIMYIFFLNHYPGDREPVSECVLKTIAKRDQWEKQFDDQCMEPVLSKFVSIS